MTPGEVRIIGGLWKRSKLPVPQLKGLRPTPDRVRETLFNWLGQSLEGWHCVDPFAGTGALGFEAASRGAAKVWMADDQAVCVNALRATQHRISATQVDIRQTDGLQLLASLPQGACDLVFLDPPYAFAAHEKALALGRRLLKPQGWLYLEADKAWPEAVLASQGWQRERYLKAGSVHAHLLKPAA